MNHASAHEAPGSNLRSGGRSRVGGGGGYMGGQQARARMVAPSMGQRPPAQRMSMHGAQTMGGGYQGRGAGMPYIPAQRQVPRVPPPPTPSVRSIISSRWNDVHIGLGHLRGYRNAYKAWEQQQMMGMGGLGGYGGYGGYGGFGGGFGGYGGMGMGMGYPMWY
ncbi:hypothetical protein DL98DRAFT_536304 [Cadophora sp. DSE1049]|nr:hypothetical protein DL98DRAFT_536304 [Cadophora sp. DSE1049]